MGVISAPLEELFNWVDEIQSWLNLNRVIDESLNALMQPLFDMSDWIGQFGERFQDIVKEKIIGPLKPVLDIIDAFLGAVNAVIDAIQAIVETISTLTLDLY
jgi:hypothetical protein